MKLRNQLALVSVVALILPWAGCTYVQEMESALRQGQQDALVTVTRSVASMFDRSGALVAELTPTPLPEGAGTDLYLHDLPAGTVVDGYLDGKAAIVDALRRFNSPPLTMDIYAGVDARRGYLFVAVNDTDIVYRNPQSTRVDQGDYVRIELAGRDGFRRSLWLNPEGPGDVFAYTRAGRRFVPERKVRGAWRDTVDGYSVELQLPRDWLGDRLGVVAVDADGEVGTLPSNGEPGRLIRRSRDLEIALLPFINDNLRLRVLDRESWVRAEGGQLADAAAEQQAPGAWMISALYQSITSGAGPSALAAPDNGRLDRPEIRDALDGNAASAWYAAGDDLAVVSAAAPLFDTQGVAGAVVAEQTTAGTLSLTNAALVRVVGLSFIAIAAIFLGLISYAFWLSNRIARLGRDVARVMDEDARELGAFPAQTAADEIGDLGRRFGFLFERIAGYTDYLTTLASKLSHELRTPLAVVRSSVDNLAHEDLSEPARQYVDRARTGSERLEHILTAMSAASRVEQSIRSAEKQPVELVSWLRDVVAAYRSTYPEQSFEFASSVDTLTLSACPELLAQMLDKLVDNARDFCPAGGVIRVRLDASADQVVVAVENDGPLLPDQRPEQLFESMVSVRDERSEQVHMGLGLTIVRLVAEFHGGVARAANRPDGSGVSVSVRLPRQPHLSV